MSTRLRELQLKTSIWSDRQFGKFDRRPSCLRHLQREIQEIIDEPDDVEEYADALILLIDSARMAGIVADDLLDAAFSKLEVNKKRKWKPADEEGVFEHD